jgi:Xaa-Pro aminopeptidase
MKIDRGMRLAEVREKHSRIMRLMSVRKLDALVLSRRHNFAWATGGGDNHVRHASDLGVASLIFKRNGSRNVLTSNIESPRIMTEELAGLEFELIELPWYSPAEKAAKLSALLGKRRVASDDGTPGSENIEPFMPPLRMALTRHEVAKYRWLGRTCGNEIGVVCRALHKGMTEEEVAGNVFAAMQRRGVKPSVLLVAADERIARYRHPIPTGAKIRKAVMVVIGARRFGLVCSLTRLVSFGKLPKEIKIKHEAVVGVDTDLIAGSQAGMSYVGVFERAQTAYARRGFPGEWRHHHQGGPTGYIEREFTVNPETPRAQKIMAGHAIAWNPSISGTKSEDTILVTSRGPEILTATPGWPVIRVAAQGRTILRPDWLVKS